MVRQYANVYYHVIGFSFLRDMRRVKNSFLHIAGAATIAAIISKQTKKQKHILGGTKKWKSL